MSVGTTNGVGVAEVASGNAGVVGVDSTGNDNSPAKSTRGRKSKLKFPMPVDDEGNEIEIQSLDWFDTHEWDSSYQTLKESDFVDKADYLEWRGGILKARGEEMLSQAVALREMGTVEEREAAMKLLNAQKKLLEIQESLRNLGKNPEEILARLGNL